MKPVLLLCVLLLHNVLGQLQFTGDAEVDFNADRVIRVLDSNGDPDVGVPLQIGPSGTVISGWDIRALLFQYDPERDELHCGLDCFSICGDADAIDNDPSASSDELISIGGVDVADLGESESFALMLDFNNDASSSSRSFDYIIGVPGGDPVAGTPLACGSTFSMSDCFGVYNYVDLRGVAPAFRFASSAADVVTVINHNPVPSFTRPDIEFTIQDITQVRESTNPPIFFEISRYEPWFFGAQAFAGSFVDSGIGEEYVPDTNDFFTIEITCNRYDACDICEGDGTTCVDCNGVPNGPDDYDVCDVCGGDGTSCLDCLGEANGAAVYDVCDVCDGDGSTCLDCLGEANGAAVYDECDVCDGDGSTCLDCNGEVNGAAVYDECDVCDGDSTSCLDCVGIPNGPNDYDVCDICGGDGTTCSDCADIPNGPNTYDVCDVCAGNGDTCLDCNGVANGPDDYDVCDVCGGDGTSCLDCADMPNGPNTYDECDVCGGDSTTCLDCNLVPNGPAMYDECDVCGGDGSTCLDCAGVPNGPAVYDDCDVCSGDGSGCHDCLGNVNGAADYDVCDVCDGDGTSCLDCNGVPNGPDNYDICDVCGGDGTSCLDCESVANGPAVYDACDVCGGDGLSCTDCAGIPNGPTVYDRCDICGGDGKSCLDCAGTPFGTLEVDNCGICGGDGSSCVCLKIHGCELSEVDYVLFEWSVLAVMEKIEHTKEVLAAINEELCRYNVGSSELAGELSSYLETANEFREVLDNFCYVNLWFYGSVTGDAELLSSIPHRPL